eukprot:SAG11_NODE_49910_length_116_cov_19.588235_1_plen_25_part_01
MWGNQVSENSDPEYLEVLRFERVRE